MNFVDNLEGDKVVWIIVLMLILISIVCIFSSTSKLLDPGETRLDIVRSQLVVVGMGLAVIIVCYNIKNIKLFRALSMLGFGFSITLLLMLDTGGFGPIKAQTINGATRTLSIFGKQLHVFEVVKIAMVMYLAWAVELCNGKDNSTLERIAVNHNLDHVKRHMKLYKKLTYLYIPFVLVTIAIMPGSNSSAIFFAGIMFLTIVIGGGNLKDAGILMVLGMLALGGCYGLYKISNGAMMQRIGTLISRTSNSIDYEKVVLESKKGTIEYQKALDKIRQPYSAKIAIHQGGLIGKGPGQSTQRYAVPDISEDFMFSFIIEEYGLLGGIFVIILYVSLLARGSIIVRNCGKDMFAKAAVAGLTILISGQGFMHMFVNGDFGILTGQTLPLISHGNSAFLCFSLAFGLILSISRIAVKRIEKEQNDADPLIKLQIEGGEPEQIQDTLTDLDNFESDEL